MAEFKLNSPKYGEKIVSVDDADLELVSKYHWNILNTRGKFYVVAHAPNIKNRKKQIKIHRLIMGLLDNPDIKVDHEDGDGLNNKRRNLRKATTAENTRNVGLIKTNTTGYKGVFKYKTGCNSGRFTATLKFNGKKIHGGYFNTAVEAAKKYNEMALEYHKEFAYLNPINEHTD